MSWYPSIRQLMQDPVRMVQTFALCRHSGIILSSIVLARVLSLESVGQVELLMLCGYLMTFFWSDAFLKGYMAKHLETKSIIAPSTFLLFCLFLGMLFMSLLFIGRHILIPLFTDRIALPGLVIYGLYQALIVPVWLAPFTGGLRNQNLLLLSAYVLVGPSFACWAGHISLPGIEGILIGLLSYALVGLVWMLTQLRFLKDLPFRKLLILLWPVTWPLILYSISSAIARSLDAWLVARYFDESVFAVFRYGAREFPLVIALAGGLSMIMIPKLIKPEAVGELKERSTRLMHFCYPLIALLMVVSPLLFQYIFGPAFQGSAMIFNIYLLLTITQLIFPQTILTAKGDTRLLWYVSIVELLVNVALSLILLHYFGLLGIVWGTFIAFAVEKVILLFLVKKRYQIFPKEIVDIKTWLGYAVLLFLAFMTSIWVFGI